ncbi:MAG TPA: hypothetical protein VNR39_14855 [Pseudolabrys sp.]|nr:hypothetical protein [Pseudolabrys sp.]
MRVSFALVVWGEAYIRSFLEFSLPTLLVDGNLIDNPLIEGSRFEVVTTKADFATLTASPLFQKLQRTLPVDFIEIGAAQNGNKYRAVSQYHIEAIRRSEDFDAIAILYPDVVWSRGAVRYAVERLNAGAIALFSPGPTILPAAAREALATFGKSYGQAGAQSLAIEPQQLAGAVLDHHHPMWDGFDWEGHCFTETPACLRWSVPGQGWLIRCFHLHPVMMKVQRNNPMFFADFEVSLDGEYTARLFDGLDGLAFATDTDRFAIVSLREAHEPPLPVPGGRPSVTAVARWAEEGALLLHRSFADVAFRWHRGHVDEAAWQAVEKRSQAIIEDVRRRLQAPDSIIRAEDPAAYRVRLGRRHRATASRAPRIRLLPSQARRSRADLARVLAYRMTLGVVWQAAGAARNMRVTRWLLQRPAVVRIWARVKPVLRPKNRMDEAASAGSLLRSIISRPDQSNTTHM